MNRQDIANLTFKVVGLYCIIQAVSLLGWIAAMMQFPEAALERPSVLFSLVSPGLLGGLGAGLWLGSRKLAARVFPQADSPSPPTRILAIHALVFSVVGLFIIANSLPQVLGVVIHFTIAWQETLQLGYLELIRPLTEPLFQLIIGVVLFLGSHRLVRVWSRLRYAGIRDKLGVCPYCDYDLTGNTSGVCPECGAPTPQAPKG